MIKSIGEKGRQHVTVVSVQEQTEEAMDGRRSSGGVLWRKGGKTEGYREGSPGHDMVAPFIKDLGTLPCRNA